MSDSSIHAEQPGYEHERRPDRGSGGLTATEWAQLADSGATTYTVGQPAHWIGVLADRSQAESARRRARRDLHRMDRAHRPRRHDRRLRPGAGGVMTHRRRRRISMAVTGVPTTWRRHQKPGRPRCRRAAHPPGTRRTYGHG